MISLMCIRCRRFREVLKQARGPIATCDAFPDGIPNFLYSGEVPHDRAINGDGGLLYEGMTEEEIGERIKALSASKT